MKKSLLGIALALATMPLTFAAQTTPPANQPAASNSTTAPKAKMHSKKAHKKTMKKSTEAIKPSGSVK
jgi:hypothetical protein